MDRHAIRGKAPMAAINTAANYMYEKATNPASVLALFQI
jgi:hypothetical protein